jgi:hypothetical protein
LKESETKDQIVKRAQIQGLILNLTRFGANSCLNETARFGKNDAVSRTVHLKKKGSPKRCRFDGTVGLLLPLDARGRGRRRFFFPLFSPTFFL